MSSWCRARRRPLRHADPFALHHLGCRRSPERTAPSTQPHMTAELSVPAQWMRPHGSRSAWPELGEHTRRGVAEHSARRSSARWSSIARCSPPAMRPCRRIARRVRPGSFAFARSASSAPICRAIGPSTITHMTPGRASVGARVDGDRCRRSRCGGLTREPVAAPERFVVDDVDLVDRPAGHALMQERPVHRQHRLVEDLAGDRDRHRDDDPARPHRHVV